MIDHTEGVERLRTLYSVLLGVPEERVYLDRWRRNLGAYGAYEEVSDRTLLGKRCNTQACGFGWASAYPEFKKEGLSYDISVGEVVYMPTESDSVYSSFYAAYLFFGLEDEASAQDLFGIAGVFHSRKLSMVREGEHDIDSDRAVLLRRIRRYLASKTIITWERNKELSKIDGAPA